MDKPYILHVASWYPTKVNEYDGDFIQRHIQCLDQYRNIVIHVQEDKKGLLEDGLIEFQTFDNREEYTLYYRPYLSIQNLLLQNKNYEKLWKIVNEKYGLPIAIHVHVMFKGLFFASKLKRKYNIPIVATEHSSIYQSINRTYRNIPKIALVRYLSDSVDFLLPVSHQLGVAIRDNGITCIQKCIPNVVPSYFYEARLQPYTGVTRFIHVSSLEDNVKNIEGILSAVRELKKRNIKFEFSIQISITFF